MKSDQDLIEALRAINSEMQARGMNTAKLLSQIIIERKKAQRESAEASA